MTEMITSTLFSFVLLVTLKNVSRIDRVSSKSKGNRLLLPDYSGICLYARSLRCLRNCRVALSSIQIRYETHPHSAT